MDSSIKVQIRVKVGDLARIDAAAGRAGMNRTQYMIDAALTQCAIDGGGVVRALGLGAKTAYARPAHAVGCKCVMCGGGK